MFGPPPESHTKPSEEMPSFLCKHTLGDGIKSGLSHATLIPRLNENLVWPPSIGYLQIAVAWYIEGGECLLSGTVEIKGQARLLPILDLCSAILLVSLMLLVFILFNLFIFNKKMQYGCIDGI